MPFEGLEILFYKRVSKGGTGKPCGRKRGRGSGKEISWVGHRNKLLSDKNGQFTQLEGSGAHGGEGIVKRKIKNQRDLVLLEQSEWKV